ncbi:hypothetical protein ONZ45_g18863 [Pleurotus djamor]|nr:hypothetical protein ONZ45_g18863 [Pleurotus djamor]
MALEGSNAILNVATGIEKLPFHRRKICHLFISDKHISKSPANIHDHALVEIDPEVENAMLRILHLASPTLETLTCVVTDAYRSTCIISKLFRMSFPRLRELTVHGFYPYPSTPNSFPALTHLHLSGNRNPHGLLQLGGLEVACPRLSDLRVSDVNGAVAFADELHDALMPPGASRREAHQMMVSKLPASIEAVIVQPASVSTFPAKCGTAKRKALMMIDRMRDTASRSEKVPLKLVESRVSGPCVLKSDWIGRLEGGNGCWV